MVIFVVVCCCWGWVGRVCGIVLVVFGYVVVICGRFGIVVIKGIIYFLLSLFMGGVFILFIFLIFIIIFEKIL